MRRGWTEVALGEVVEHRNEFFEIDDLSTYKRCRVKLHAKGIQQRDAVPGAMIKTKTQQRCRANDFMVAEIDAKVGGFGIVPKSLDGAIVSSHYFLFEANPVRLDFRFLGFFCRTRRFFEQVAAQGSTNYAAIRPRHVLDYKIPLPPLAEQERLVARLDAIEHRLHRVQKLREESEKELLAALRSAFHEIEADADWLEMGEVAPLVRREVKIEPEGSYPELGIRSFGRGTFHKPEVIGIETTKRLFEIHEGDLIFNNVFAWEGAIAIAQKIDHGRVGSHRFITCLCDRNRVLPEILQFYFLTSSGLEKIGKASPGGAGRNRTLGLKKLGEISVPIPPIRKQEEFLRLLNLRRTIQGQSQKAVTRHETLLPSLLDQIFNQ